MKLEDDFKSFLVFLSMFDNTYLKNQQIIDSLGEDVSLKHFCKSEFDGILTKENLDKMKERADINRINNYYNNMLDSDIVLLTKFDKDYPEKLRDLPDAPFFLFCRGDLSLLNEKALAIVGTRKPTNYGRVVTNRIVGDVAREGVVIVSGLAYGVDSIAHRKCLEVGGKTIAVLGAGLNEIYPAEHISLAEEIAKKGLLVSEYSPNKKATKYSFPQRNRIIAGLSDGVLITEASIKSGTIHTKDYALDYGKNIYSVPGNIDSPLSELTNDIIKSSQAQLVTKASDILVDYNIVKGESGIKKAEKSSNYQLSIEESVIVNLLKDGMKEMDFLAKNSGLSISDLNSNLTMLEIRGIISRLPGSIVSLN